MIETVRAMDGIGRIYTDNYANRNLEYYYYVPETAFQISTDDIPLLVLVSGLSGKGEAFVTDSYRQFARQQAMAIIAPSFQFDEANWETGSSYQFPSAWSGNALLSMVDQLSEKSSLSFGHYSFLGFSAGAQFALRFCVWRPDLCSVCTAHGSGGSISPQEYLDVDFLVTVGDADSDYSKAHARTSLTAARKQGIHMVVKRYPVGHELSEPQIQDSLNFISKYLRPSTEH